MMNLRASNYSNKIYVYTHKIEVIFWTIVRFFEKSFKAEIDSRKKMGCFFTISSDP